MATNSLDPPPAPASVNQFKWDSAGLTNPNQYPYSYPNGVLEQSCDPVCVANNAVLNQNMQCQANTICILDQAVINMINSNVGGNVSIDQYCGSSGSGKSLCYIVGADINEISSLVGGSSNINQYCGSCFVAPANATNPSQTQGVPCFGNGTGGSSSGGAGFFTNAWAWIKDNKLLSAGIIAAIIFVIALVVFIIYEMRG